MNLPSSLKLSDKDHVIKPEYDNTFISHKCFLDGVNSSGCFLKSPLMEMDTYFFCTEKLQSKLVWLFHGKFSICSKPYKISDAACAVRHYNFPKKVVSVSALLFSKVQLEQCLMRSSLIQRSGHCKKFPVCSLLLCISSAARDVLGKTLQWAKFGRHWRGELLTVLQ